MNRAVSLALWSGTLAGVGLCMAATVAAAFGVAPAAQALARLGVLALLVTPPLRLAVVASGFFAGREPRFGLAATAVLAALVVVAALAAP